MRFKKKITKYEVFSHSEGEVLKNFKTFINEKEALNYMGELQKTLGMAQINFKDLEIDGGKY